MRSKKTKEQIFKDGFNLFFTKPIPCGLLDAYLNDTSGEGSLNLQYWISCNMRSELIDWSTAIGIIEAVEHLFYTALENGNLSVEVTENNFRVL